MPLPFPFLPPPPTEKVHRMQSVKKTLQCVGNFGRLCELLLEHTERVSNGMAGRGFMWRGGLGWGGLGWGGLGWGGLGWGGRGKVERGMGHEREVHDLPSPWVDNVTFAVQVTQNLDVTGAVFAEASPLAPLGHVHGFQATGRLDLHAVGLAQQVE